MNKWHEKHPNYSKEHSKEWREQHLEYSKKQSRDYYLKHKKEIAILNKNWRKDHPGYNNKYQKKNRIKYRKHNRARTRINNYIRRGQLTRDICAICGKENSEAHHENYDEPLVIIWLCNKHHTESRRLENETN